MANGQPRATEIIGGNLDWQPVATGDFNHDGADDIIWHSTGSGADLLWSMGAPHQAITANDFTIA